MPESPDLNKLYREAGVVLPDLTQRRLDEVERFHETILRNRRSHLESEINSADKRITDRDQSKARLDQRRDQVMGLLNSGGALEHFTSLREELGRAESEVTTLKERLETAERLESTQTELKLQRNQLVQKLGGAASQITGGESWAEIGRRTRNRIVGSLKDRRDAG